MGEKKCCNCENMDFCAMYLGLKDMAHLLTANRYKDLAGQPGFVSMVNFLADDCKRFKAIE